VAEARDSLDLWRTCSNIVIDDGQYICMDNGYVIGVVYEAQTRRLDDERIVDDGRPLFKPGSRVKRRIYRELIEMLDKVGFDYSNEYVLLDEAVKLIYKLNKRGVKSRGFWCAVMYYLARFYGRSFPYRECVEMYSSKRKVRYLLKVRDYIDVDNYINAVNDGASKRQRLAETTTVECFKIVPIPEHDQQRLLSNLARAVSRHPEISSVQTLARALVASYLVAHGRHSDARRLLTLTRGKRALKDLAEVLRRAEDALDEDLKKGLAELSSSSRGRLRASS